MEVSTAEFYDAIKEIAQGNTTNAVTNAKRVSDYVEQTRQTNNSTLKDVFLTKDDKVEIMDKIGNVKTSLIAWMFVFWVGQVAVIIGILSYILKKS